MSNLVERIEEHLQGSRTSTNGEIDAYKLLKDCKAALSEQEAVAWARNGSLTSLQKGYSDREVVNREKSEEQHFVVPLFAHPQPQKVELPQSVEEFIEEYAGLGASCSNCLPQKEVRTLMAGKALVPVEPTEKMLEAAQKIEFYIFDLIHCKTDTGLATTIYKAMLDEAAKGE